MDSLKINLLRSTVCPKQKYVPKVGTDKLGRDLNIDGGKYYTQFHHVETNNLIPGFGFRLINDKINFLAHILPTIENLKELPNKVADIIDIMRKSQSKSYDETLGFITGGLHLDPKSPNYDASMNVLDALYGVAVEEKGVPTTVIAEHFNPKATMNLYSNQGEITLFDEHRNGIISRIKDVKDATQEEVNDILSEHFNFVEISPKIPVKIVDSLPEIARK